MTFLSSAEERLLLWAVAGLRGVVIGGQPGSRSAPQPRAVLWGEHCGSLFRQPQACAHTCPKQAMKTHPEPLIRHLPLQTFTPTTSVKSEGTTLRKMHCAIRAWAMQHQFPQRLLNALHILITMERCTGRQTWERFSTPCQQASPSPTTSPCCTLWRPARTPPGASCPRCATFAWTLSRTTRACLAHCSCPTLQVKVPPSLEYQIPPGLQT